MTRLDRDPATNGLVADQRITYQLIALDRITADEPVFQEGFHSSVTKLQYLPGTEPSETLNEPQDQALGWNVPLALTAGGFRALMTGVRRVYRAELLAGPRTDHAQRSLEPNQDEYCYRTESDTIGEITIGVESTTLAFQGTQNGTRAYVWRAGNSDPDDPVEPRRVTSPANSPITSLVSARFQDMRRGNTACVVVAW